MLALATIVVVGVASVADVASPRPDGWVSDEAHVLDAAAQRRINDVAEHLHASRGIELAVVTVDDVPGTPKQFASELFNVWGIGSVQSNNGVLVLLVRDRRRLEIETGSGIEAALTAEWLSSMEGEVMVPRFKAGDFAGGLIGGVKAIEEHIRDAPAESTSVAPQGEYRSNGAVGGGSEDGYRPDVAQVTSGADPRWGLLLGGGAGVLGIALWSFAQRFRRRGTCTACVPPRRMIELDEIADDAYLEPGQQMEESVGSVNYVVLLCPGCQATRTRRVGRWWSGYEQCPSCSYKTRHSIKSTLRSATYDHEGEVEVTTSCANCGKSDSYRYAIPKEIRVDSSSDSGSSSWSSSDSSSNSFGSSSSGDSDSSGFSGGGSHGGGAGSSW